MNEYENFMSHYLETKAYKNSDIIDFCHEEELIANNLELEIAHLMNELTE